MTETSQKITCTKCNKEFLIIPLEQQFYAKKQLPLPRDCPRCRQKERLTLRNEDHLYKRTCDKCQKSILSSYSQESPYEVYCQECFWQSLN